MRPPDTSQTAPAGPDPFWVLARRMLRYRALLALTLLMVLFSAVTLSVGLLGILPVLDSIFGAHKDLPTLAAELNQTLAKSSLAPQWLRVPGGVIDVLPQGERTALAVILLALCVLTFLGAVTTFLHAYLSQTVVNRAITAIRRETFHAAVRAPLRAVMDKGGASDTISRIVNDTTQLANGFNVLLSKAVLQVFKGVAALVVAFLVNAWVALGALVVAPLMYTIIRKLGKRIKRGAGAALASTSDLYAVTSESLQALRVVKAHTAERFETGRFHRINKTVMRELNRVRTARALASPLTEMLSLFLLCGLTLIAGNLIINKKLTPSEFIMVIGALAAAGASLKPLTGIINDIQAASPAAARVRDLIHAPVEPGHGHKLRRIARHNASIEFRDVRLTYPHAQRPALDGISLTIPHGSRVAFVGPNGSGKTTLLSLVPRLLDADAGSLLIDGVNIREVGIRSLREQIGVVTQETILFRATVRENIAYGSNAGDHEVIDAARRARAHEFIERLPQRYDTPVAESGASLSGGQRQRLAIARAILRDPAILILDEATSMIDADSEAHIAAALADFSKGRTTLIVAHRLSTVLSCDSIVVLESGRIVDQGTHAQLLARCPLYRKLAQTDIQG